MDGSTITAVALTMGVMQIIKQFNIDTRFLPLFAIAIAILANFGLAQSYTIPLAIEGIAIGLSSMGLWTGTKVLATGRA